MEGCRHFSHPHNLSFHKSLDALQSIACAACNLPCNGGPPAYSCQPCNFFLHDQCFNAARSLIHPSHPPHPLTLLPSPTYPSGSFICNSCNQTGSGLCFGCSICDFDIHVHCAYNDLKQKSVENPDLPDQIHLKSHPNHPLKYLPKPRYDEGTCTCDVCGTECDGNGALYHCDVCDYDAHLDCVNLAETVRRKDHEHPLSLLPVNPYKEMECDVCREVIVQKNSVYFCGSGCDYGTHVKCVAGKAVSAEKAAMDKMMKFQVDMMIAQNKMRTNQLVFDALVNRRHYW